MLSDDLKPILCCSCCNIIRNNSWYLIKHPIGNIWKCIYRICLSLLVFTLVEYFSWQTFVLDCYQMGSFSSPDECIFDWWRSHMFMHEQFSATVLSKICVNGFAGLVQRVQCNECVVCSSGCMIFFYRYSTNLTEALVEEWSKTKRNIYEIKFNNMYADSVNLWSGFL